MRCAGLAEPSGRVFLPNVHELPSTTGVLQAIAVYAEWHMTHLYCGTGWTRAWASIVICMFVLHMWHAETYLIQLSFVDAFEQLLCDVADAQVLATFS